MPATSTPTPTIDTYLTDPLRVGEPDVAGPLAVYSLFGPEPEHEYVPFAQGRANGVKITEIETEASVNDLVIENPTGTAVLIFEGEEVLGAQQNRTFDVSALIAPGTRINVPVSCVEVGRWDASRHVEEFSPAPQTAYPELRRAKALQVREAVAAGREARASQVAVWNDIADKSQRYDAHSPTGAMHDIYEQRRDRLHELNEAIDLEEGQSGALVAIGGRFAVLDWVSRPDAFAALHGPLVQGYALDALRAQDADPPSIEDAGGFVSLIAGATASERDGIALGRELRFAEQAIAGSGLVAGTELVQLTAFAEHGAGEQPDPQSPRAGRIRRPSRRR
jgi:hypothetical protein